MSAKTSTWKREARCPHCGVANDRHTGLEGTAPSEGAVAICWRCKELSIFLADGSQRKPSHEELVELMRNRRVRKALEHIRADPDPLTAMKRSVCAS